MLHQTRFLRNPSPIKANPFAEIRAGQNNQVSLRKPWCSSPFVWIIYPRIWCHLGFSFNSDHFSDAFSGGKRWFACLVLKNPLIEEKHTWNSCFFSDLVFFSSGAASERCRPRPPCTQNQKNHTLSKGFFDPSGALTPRWFSRRLEVSWALFGLAWQETNVTIESI